MTDFLKLYLKKNHNILQYIEPLPLYHDTYRIARFLPIHSPIALCRARLTTTKTLIDASTENTEFAFTLVDLWSTLKVTTACGGQRSALQQEQVSRQLIGQVGLPCAAGARQDDASVLLQQGDVALQHRLRDQSVEYQRVHVLTAHT